MPSENTPYVNYLKNEEYLKTLKEQFEGRYGDQLTHINYTYIVHVKPEKEIIDIDREFYVKFTIMRGKVEYEVVYDTKPKKLKVGWTWHGEPERWKKFFKTGEFKHLKQSVKISQFQRLNMDAIKQLSSIFFGSILAIARDFNFIEGEVPGESPEPEEREKKPPEQLRKEIEEINAKINNEGWVPALSHDLAWAYFDLGDLEKAEAEFFKYFDETKSQDIPGFIFCKIAAVRGEKIDLIMGSTAKPDEHVINLPKEELMEAYEQAKESYLKGFQK